MKTIIRPVITLLLFASALMANAQVPFLSSHPNAQAVLFLDFDGHTVSGTSWNYNGPIACSAAGLDNSQITEVFNRVAEDYRPFNINVTTDSTKFLAAPANQRMRVILTTSSSWYGAAGGVAFVGSFSWGDDNPCFVFSALLNYNVKNISEAASHEAGHTLGLYHQASYDANCTKLTDYNAGTGAGEIGWAPIMGVGYYRNMTLWNNGPNSYGCSNLQSDLDIITSVTNGFGYRTDDHSNDFSNVTVAAISNNAFTTSGIIEKNTDVDLFKFTMPAYGRFELNAIPYNVGTGNTGSDLDLQVSLINSSQNVLNVYNPGTLLSSVVDTSLNPGVYYIRVEGKGNLYAPNYASLGSYSLQGKTTPGSVLPIRKLELRGAMDGDRHSLNWTVEADEQLVSQVLEISVDNRNFQPLIESPTTERMYVYRPTTPLSAQYRLHVIFDNGHEYYSNIVTIRNDPNAPRPKLISTIIHSSEVTITSPGNYDYVIVDMNGKTISKGKLVNGTNTVNAHGITTGLYLLRTSNLEQSWTDKFIRQ